MAHSIQLYGRAVIFAMAQLSCLSYYDGSPLATSASVPMYVRLCMPVYACLSVKWNLLTHLKNDVEVALCCCTLLNIEPSGCQCVYVCNHELVIECGVLSGVW